MTQPFLALAWPDPAAQPLSMIAVIVFLVVGTAACWRTPINRTLMRGAALVRARQVAAAFLAAYASAIAITGFATAWDPLYLVVVGCVGLLVAGVLAFMAIVSLEEHEQKERDRIPPPIPLDLRSLNVDGLEVTAPPYPHSCLAQGGLRLYKDMEDRNVLALPRGSVASSVLQHNGETLAKLVIPDRDNNNTVHGSRVAILGLDTTGNPFLLELPPEYKDRSIEECERWLINAHEGDEVVTS